MTTTTDTTHETAALDALAVLMRRAQADRVRHADRTLDGLTRATTGDFYDPGVPRPWEPPDTVWTSPSIDCADAIAVLFGAVTDGTYPYDRAHLAVHLERIVSERFDAPDIALYLAPRQQLGVVSAVSVYDHLRATSRLHMALSLTSPEVRGWLADPRTFPLQSGNGTLYLLWGAGPRHQVPGLIWAAGALHTIWTPFDYSVGASEPAMLRTPKF